MFVVLPSPRGLILFFSRHCWKLPAGGELHDVTSGFGFKCVCVCVWWALCLNFALVLFGRVLSAVHCIHLCCTCKWRSLDDVIFVLLFSRLWGGAPLCRGFIIACVLLGNYYWWVHLLFIDSLAKGLVCTLYRCVYFCIVVLCTFWVCCTTHILSVHGHCLNKVMHIRKPLFMGYKLLVCCPSW